MNKEAYTNNISTHKYNGGECVYICMYVHTHTHNIEGRQSTCIKKGEGLKIIFRIWLELRSTQSLSYNFIYMFMK